jgi:heptosyltransferase-2
LAELCGESRTILEIGCSYGFFLDAARRQGWKVDGVELGEYAGKYAREELGLPVRTGTLFDLPQEYGACFAAIVAWHVLEHEPDPLGLLNRAHELLRPGGIIGLRVPNMESWVARLAGPHWQWLSPPEHIYLFSAHTLSRLLTKAGFEVVLTDSARGPAHNTWFEIVRARAKQRFMRQANGMSDSTAKGGFDRPRIYEDKWWYRLCHRAFEASSLPADLVLSPWLSRRTLEAELVMFARKTDCRLPLESSSRKADLHATSEANSLPVLGAEAAARASFLKMTRRKWGLVRAAERGIRFALPLLPKPGKRTDAGELPSSILVMEYWNLGDLAIVVPFLKNLRRSYPEARISLLVNAGLASFLEGQGLVDEFIPVRVPWVQHHSRWKKYNPFSGHWISFARTLQALRRRQFDWAVSGRMDLRDNFLLWLSGAARRIGYGVGGGGFLLTDRVAPDLSRPHRADIWLHLLEALGKPANRDLGGFQLTGGELASGNLFLQGKGIPSEAFLIGLHPGARFAVRRWGDERFAEVARNILRESNAHILWFSDPGNPSVAPPLERCHPVSLEFRSFLSVLSRCRILICNDSGPMHVANLLGVPVVAVFGPQKPEWFGPRGARDRVVIRPEFWCRPCFDYCIYDEPHCLRTITPGEAIASVRESLKEVRRGVSLTVESYAAAAPGGRGKNV